MLLLNSTTVSLLLSTNSDVYAKLGNQDSGGPFVEWLTENGSNEE